MTIYDRALLNSKKKLIERHHHILLAKQHEKALLEEEWFLQHIRIIQIKIRTINQICRTVIIEIRCSLKEHITPSVQYN